MQFHNCHHAMKGEKASNSYVNNSQQKDAAHLSKNETSKEDQKEIEDILEKIEISKQNESSNIADDNNVKSEQPKKSNQSEIKEVEGTSILSNLLPLILPKPRFSFS